MKYLDVDPVVNWAWWWVLSPFAVAVAWWMWADASGWTKKQATDEMVNGGFGFHPMWQNLLRYIDGLDVDSIKAQVAQQGPWQ